MDNQKKEYNRLKHNLEKWREIILVLHSILKWEQKYYAAVIAVLVTLLYLFIWYLDLTIITCVALTGLFATLFDYFYPKLAKMFFKSENWRGAEEKKFEEIADELFHLKSNISSTWKFIFDAKTDKSTLFILASSTVCVIFAWIGSTMNNLLLAYLTTLALLLFPGLSHNGHFKPITQLIEGRLNIKLGGGEEVKKQN